MLSLLLWPFLLALHGSLLEVQNQFPKTLPNNFQFLHRSWKGEKNHNFIRFSVVVMNLKFYPFPNFCWIYNYHTILAHSIFWDQVKNNSCLFYFFYFIFWIWSEYIQTKIVLFMSFYSSFCICYVESWFCVNGSPCLPWFPLFVFGFFPICGRFIIYSNFLQRFLRCCFQWKRKFDPILYILFCCLSFKELISTYQKEI